MTDTDTDTETANVSIVFRASYMAPDGDHGSCFEVDADAMDIERITGRDAHATPMTRSEYGSLDFIEDGDAQTLVLDSIQLGLLLQHVGSPYVPETDARWMWTDQDGDTDSAWMHYQLLASFDTFGFTFDVSATVYYNAQ